MIPGPFRRYWAGQGRSIHRLEFFAEIHQTVPDLIVWGGTGRLSLLETASDRFQELSRTIRIFSATAWPHVVLSGGRLCCKDRNGNLKCFIVRG